MFSMGKPVYSNTYCYVCVFEEDWINDTSWYVINNTSLTVQRLAVHKQIRLVTGHRCSGKVTIGACPCVTFTVSLLVTASCSNLILYAPSCDVSLCICCVVNSVGPVCCIYWLRVCTLTTLQHWRA